MIARLTTPLARLQPDRVVRPAAGISRRASLYGTRVLWTFAGDSPSHLGLTELEALQAQYPFRRAYRYDQESLLRRGGDRAGQLLARPGARDAESFLEIACSDGMVTALLQRAGKTAFAVDRRRDAFDPRAMEAGARLVQTDAAALAFDDPSFDYAFSYNAFEHFTQPERVLKEMARVVKPGGYVYLRFGPLYYSPGENTRIEPSPFRIVTFSSLRI